MGAIEQAVERISNMHTGGRFPAFREARTHREAEPMLPRDRPMDDRVQSERGERLSANTSFYDDEAPRVSRGGVTPASQKGYFELPYQELNAAGMVVAGAGSRNQLSEEYRAIKRPILTAIDIAKYDGIKNTNMVMVTSCVSGEGKTFSAINLAISIAMERDRSVLLIDGDVTNPSCGERLGFNAKRKGLTDLLLDPDLNINDVVCQSDIPNLRFLPAGSSAHHVTELLSSRSMAELVEGLSRSFKDRVIIFDTAPMLLTSEASVVADLAGQIVFVVAAESTTQGMVSDALKMVNNHSRVGYILNKTRKKQSNIYGYGYGYGVG